MNEPGIAAMQGRECAPQTIGIGRHKNQVHMIGHQAPGSNFNIGGAAALSEPIAIKAVIAILKKHLLPPIATLCDVMWNIGNDDAGETGHGRRMG